MDLQTLADTFKNQAREKGYVIVSRSTFQTAGIPIEENFDSLVKGSFMLPADRDLTIQVDYRQIPKPAEDKLAFPGTISILNIDNTTVNICVSILSGNKINVLLKIHLPDSWKFEDSFIYLDGYPFDTMVISQKYFIFTNTDISSYQWENETISLKTGLNFLSDLKLDGFGPVLRLLKDILKIKDSYIFCGPIDPSKINLTAPSPEDIVLYPPASLRARLSDIGFKLQHLSVGYPTILLEITEKSGSSQEVWLKLELRLIIEENSEKDLIFQAAFHTDDDALDFYIRPDPEKPVSIEDVIDLVAGEDFTRYIPPPLKDVFSHFGLKGFSTSLFPEDIYMASLGLSIGTVKPWTFFGDLILKDLTLDLSVLDPFGNKIISADFSATLEFFPEVFKGVFQIEITDDFTVIGQYIGIVDLNDLVSYISQGTIHIPKDIIDITFSDFYVSFKKEDKNLTYTISGNSDIDLDLPMLGEKIEADFRILIQSSNNQLTYQLFGGLTIGDCYFTAEIDLGSDDKKISASWEALEEDYLEINGIIKDLGFESIDIPKGLDLGLKAAYITYDLTKKILILEAESINYGKAVFVGLKNQQQHWQFFFGLGVDKTINLSNLPVVDQILSKEQTLGIEQIQVIVSSHEIDQDLASTVNQLIKSGYPRVPEKGMSKGVALSMQFDFGGHTVPLSIGTGGSSQQDSIAVHPAAVPNQTAADGTTWFNIQKNLGPVCFQRVGVQYKESVLWFLLDASLTMAGLDVTVMGLSVGSPLTTFEPHFNIEGLSIDYSNSELEIGGAFLNIPPVPPITLEFGGSVIVKAEDFGIEAVGAYATLSGFPSMFIFARITGVFGGPPYFVITGFAGGFGFFSRLRIPGQDEIFQFPFVAGLTDPAAIGGKHPTPIQALKKLLGDSTTPGWVTPQIGEIWLAAGIQFTTFKILNSSALLTLRFGNDFAIALIGLCNARFPMAGPVVYANVELQLEAVFDPFGGLISLSAVLSPKSFLVDPSCHLTGGFSLCFWFGNNPHAGDFVLTVGGYSPYFDVPDWYPKEEKVGINWSLDTYVSITGGAYFALTPAALMAGGELDVKFHYQNLKAWFTANADIVMWWNPFHFLAHIGVSIGASYTTKILFTSQTFTLEAGADLTLWGPPTGGTVTVHWWILSFTFNFGAPQSGGLKKQTWDQFKAVLPEPQDVVKIAAVQGLTTAPKSDKEISVPATDSAYDDEAPRKWLVRAHNFRFTTDSAVPLYRLYVGEQSDQAYVAGDKLNIKPMQETGLNAFKKLYIKRADGQEVDLLDPRRKWGIEANVRDVSKALWGTGSPSKLEPGDEQLVQNQLAGFTVTVPAAVPGFTPGKIDVKENLGYLVLPPGTNPLKTGLPPCGPVPKPVLKPSFISAGL